MLRKDFTGGFTKKKIKCDRSWAYVRNFVELGKLLIMAKILFRFAFI